MVFTRHNGMVYLYQQLQMLPRQAAKAGMITDHLPHLTFCPAIGFPGCRHTRA